MFNGLGYLESENDQKLTDCNVPHTTFTIMRWLASAKKKTLSVNYVFLGDHN